MPNVDANRLPEGYRLDRDQDGDWILSGPPHVILFSEPGEGLLIGDCDEETAIADALEAIAAAQNA